MMNMKKAVMLAVLAVAVAALALPIVGLRARASAGSAKPLAPSGPAFSPPANVVPASPRQEIMPEARADLQEGKISRDTLEHLGLIRSKEARAASSASVAPASDPEIQSGQPLVMDTRGPLSASIIVSIGGRDTQFEEVALVADWDGREDCTADREQKVDDFTSPGGVPPLPPITPDETITRAAISEHAYANGFTENVFYYGTSNGRFVIGTDTNPDLGPGGPGLGLPAVDTRILVSIPDLVTTGTSAGITLLNRPADDCTDDQVTVTGIAVNPVADLGDFGAAFCGVIGEVVYVSVLDTEGCSSRPQGEIWRTRIFAFGFTDAGGPGVSGVTPVGALQLLRSRFSNVAGVAVDDDGSLYYQLVDLIQFTGGSLFKATEQSRTVAGCPSPRVNRVITAIPDPPTLNSWLGTAAAPFVTVGGSLHTNFGFGMSGTYGNITSIATGACNVLYAAVAGSRGATGVTAETAGLFAAPGAFATGTPSMVISFSDCSGAFDSCTVPFAGAPGQPGQGILPIANGVADVAGGTGTLTAGVNSFRVFALGVGPDLRPAAGQTSAIATATLLRIPEFQIDPTIHNGISVNEEGTVFVISGGTPAGIGRNPSATFSDILCFEDMCPMDRRGDFVDLRANVLPNPPASGGNVGDGDSDFFDHVFYQAPLDQVTLTPTGLAGLADGFLLHTNRLRNRNLATLANLPNGGTQGNNAASGPLVFEDFDPGHQVAGGDDQRLPNRGDDSDTVVVPDARCDDRVNLAGGTPALPGSLSGGFEFVFGPPTANITQVCPAPIGTVTNLDSRTCVWNALFLNSNGNVTFTAGDTDATPTVPEFRAGLRRIAPAWADLNPASRSFVDPVTGAPTGLSTFPVQAIGFANVNAFRIRWINVPETGREACTGLGGGRSNTFSVTLYDDGTGPDENTTESFTATGQTTLGNNVDDGPALFDRLEGPTDLRFSRVDTPGATPPFSLVGCSSRVEGSGNFIFEYCRMDLLGTATRPVIVGYSVGGTSPLTPPGLCEVDLGEAARSADTAFGVIQGTTASIAPCLLGEGTEPHVFELFNSGFDPSIGGGGEVTLATPDFDLRFEGEGACTPLRQLDRNRDKVGFFGVGCTPPGVDCQTIAAGAFVTPGGAADRDLIDALCAVQLNLLGCGFFPNEVTTICQGFQSETGIPLQRPGKTVSTAAALVCDTNADGIPDATIPLTTVTPVSRFLLRGTLTPLTAQGLPGTAFPLACCGGLATLTVSTTFTTGDNNVFGAFVRTDTCTIDLGTRAPVVISVTPSSGDCAVPQDLLITGACFLLPNGAPNVTSVFAVQRDNPANRLAATRFVVLNNNLVDALFTFGTANAGRTFLIFASGPGGTSRNLTALPPGAPAGCPLGNEQGVQVTFTCATGVVRPGVPEITACRLDRSTEGIFTLIITGRNIRGGATVTIGGVSPRKVRFRDETPVGSNTFTRLNLKGRLCANLPGRIRVTNPDGGSVEFLCNVSCPSN